MLRSMRENTGSWLIKILLGIIVVAFIFMGAGSFNASRASKIATVNGETINISQYQTAYNNLLENMRRQMGNQLNEEMIKALNLKKQALDSVIDTTLLRQAAEKNDIRVPDSELAESISRIPAFQKNGFFDKQRYKILLSQNRLTPDSFEFMQKEAMLMDKLRSVVTRSAKVSDSEAREWFKWENASMDIDFAVFSPQSYKDIEITDKMIDEYYQAHKTAYKTDTTRQARYVKFDPETYKSATHVTDEEIEEYYLNHEEDYQLPETVSARHILFKVAKDASPETIEAVRKKALEIMEKAKAGEDFAKLAETYSEGPSKKDGGQLGTFKRKDMVKPFSDKAFTMGVGEISEPVKTRFGWHIIKVEAHNDASTSPLEAVATKIREKLIDRKTKNSAYDAAAALYDATFDGEEFVNNAKENGLNLVTTDFFSKIKGPKGIRKALDFAKTAFALPMLEISDISEIGDAYFLIQVIKEKPGKIPALETIKDKVKKDTRREQQKKAAEAAAAEFLAKAKTSGSMLKTGEETGVAVKSVTLENRSKASKALDGDKLLNAEAFKLSETNKFSKVITGKKGFYVLAYKNRKEPPQEAFQMTGRNITARLLNQKQNEMYNSWLSHLRESSEIIISENFINN